MKKIFHFYDEKDIKKEYKFWDSQLVPHFNKEIPIELGPIKSDFKEEDIKKEPYELPENMVWEDVDITKEGIIEEIYKFLNENYYEVDEYQEQYNKEFLRWQFTPIKNIKYKNILLSIRLNKKMIGFFSGLPMKLSIYGKEIILYNISFLCIDKDYRHHKLAEIMFKEMFRRTYKENVYQNIFVSKRLIPKPFAECIYYYRMFDVQEMIDFGFLPKNVDRKKYEIKDETTVKFRPFEKKDIKSVTKLLYDNQKKYKIYSIFSEDEVEHWLIPKKDVIYSFVREDSNGNITDFTSFYKVESKIRGRDQNWSYIYFNIATSISSKELLENSMVLAKKCGFDNIIVNSIMDYENVSKELNLNSDLDNEKCYGSLKYYFNNYICPETEAKDMSLILI